MTTVPAESLQWWEVLMAIGLCVAGTLLSPLILLAPLYGFILGKNHVRR